MVSTQGQNNPQRNPLPNPQGDDDIVDKWVARGQAYLRRRQRQQNQPNQTPPRASTARRPPTASSNLNPTINYSNNCIKCSKDMLGMLSIINDSVSKVLDALKAEHLLDKKKAEQLKKEQEQRERREKENQLESTGRKLSGTLKQAVAPLKSAMDAILKFILFTIAGRAVGKILKWFADPANERKVKTLTRFLQNWWPALLGAFVLFGTRFGAAIRGTIKMAVSTILYLRKIGIPGMLAGLKSLGKQAAVGALVAGGLILGGAALKKITEFESDDKDKEPSKSPPGPGATKMQNGGIVPRMSFFGPQVIRANDLAYAEGGGIDESSGLSITGAGPDTQLIAAQPGEIVISKAAVDKFGPDFFLGLNRAAGSTNQPKFVNNIQLAKDGGMVGGLIKGLQGLPQKVMGGFNKFIPQPNKPANAAINAVPANAPKISSADYHSLLAIAASEDSDPQGRADVAQSLYNRLFASQSYGMNFLPTGGRNTLKDFITAGGGKTTGGQYQPTFENKNDWYNIKDRKTAAIALSNAKKINLNKAMQMLSDTEKALKNTTLQRNAQRHVGGRHSFFGVSEHGNIGPGDALRYDTIGGKKVPRKDNFFTHYPAEETRYTKERGNVAAPIPKMLLMPKGEEQSSIQFNKSQLVSMAPKITPPKPRPTGGVSITELPPIDLRNVGKKTMAPSHPDVPSFSVIPPKSDRYGKDGTYALMGLNVDSIT